MKQRVIIRGLAVCAVVWVAVIVAQKVFGSFRTTADSLQEAVSEASFENWSQRTDEPAGEVAAAREEHIREIARIINQLDFREREKARENRVAEDLFWQLSAGEQILFVDLTIKESMNRWMGSFDGLDKQEQKKFVERALKDIEDGMADEDVERMEELGAEMVEKIMNEGFRAYLENTTAETKMELAPLMESMNEMMQGLRGQDWEGPQAR